MAAIIAYALVALGKLCVWIYGCFRWGPYYRAYRLSAFVVLPYGLASAALGLYVFGLVLGAAGLFTPDRKRSLAILGLVLNTFGAYAVFVTNVDDTFGFLYALLFAWLPRACR
jgi:hypothetical protein